MEDISFVQKKHRRLGSQSQDRWSQVHWLIGLVYLVKTTVDYTSTDKGYTSPILKQTFAQIGLTFDLRQLLGKWDRGPQKPTMDPEKMIPRKNGYDFWNQHPRKPPGTKFHQNRTTLVFGHFLGAPPPKNISFLVKKCSDQNFDPIFVFSTFENLCIPNFSKIGWHLKIG